MMATIKRLQVMFTIICVVFLGGSFTAAAHDKVVVIPLLGNEATGNATRDDVLESKTFSNSSATGLTGTRPLAPLEKTGQTVSRRTGDDGYYESGVSIVYYYGYFSAGTYVVTDNLSRLTWQKSANNGNMFWNSAIDYCNDLELFVGGSRGYIAKDWRLPNIKELQSLINFGYSNPALSNALGTGKWTTGDPFTQVLPAPYWSSTTDELDNNKAWTVHLSTGAVVAYDKNIVGGLFVWCVRGDDW